MEVEKKVEKMFSEGVVKEIENFSKIKISKDLSANKIIGINEIKDYLREKITLLQTKELISQKTRHFLKV